MFIHVHIHTYYMYVPTFIMLVLYCIYLHTSTVMYSQQNRQCFSLITCTFFFIVILPYIVCNMYAYIQIKTFLLSPVNINKLLCTLCILYTIRRMGTDQNCYAFCVFSILNIKFRTYTKWVDAWKWLLWWVGFFFIHIQFLDRAARAIFVCKLFWTSKSFVRNNYRPIIKRRHLYARPAL